MSHHDPDQYLPVEIAGNVAGISPRTLVGNAGNAAVSVEPDADSDEHTVTADAVSPAARSQLEAIRDEWLRPLIDRNEELARENGRLQAERDAAVQERDRVADRLAEVARRDAAALREAEERARVLQEQRDRLASQVETLNTAWRSAGSVESAATPPYKEPWWKFWERWQ